MQGTNSTECTTSFSKSSATCSNPENDFVEVDLDELTYQGLLKACCEELKVSVDKVKKIRKLPNVHITKDSDVQRLIKGQELELEITPRSVCPLSDLPSPPGDTFTDHNARTNKIANKRTVIDQMYVMMHVSCA